MGRTTNRKGPWKRSMAQSQKRSPTCPFRSYMTCSSRSQTTILPRSRKTCLQRGRGSSNSPPPRLPILVAVNLTRRCGTNANWWITTLGSPAMQTSPGQGKMPRSFLVLYNVRCTDHGRSHLRRHRETFHHLSSSTFPCDVCKKERAFNRLDTLQRHYRQCHPGIEPPSGRAAA